MKKEILFSTYVDKNDWIFCVIPTIAISKSSVTSDEIMWSITTLWLFFQLDIILTKPIS